MKKPVAAMLTLAAATFAYAIENSEYSRGSHRIYIVPNISFDLMEKIEDEQETWESEGAQYGKKVAYEFFKPNNIYNERK